MGNEATVEHAQVRLCRGCDHLLPPGDETPGECFNLALIQFAAHALQVNLHLYVNLTQCIHRPVDYSVTQNATVCRTIPADRISTRYWPSGQGCWLLSSKAT